MTDIIASTRAAFFEHYNHPFDPNETAYNEFLSLATSRNWKQGSKKDAFGNAWRLCFGPGIPVGIEPETYDMNGRAFDYTGDELAEQLQNLNLRATKPTRHEVQHGQVAGLFTHYYGSDVSRLEKWQMLCSDCGVAPIPTSITQCKKALKTTHINICAFLEAKKNQEDPAETAFQTRRDLRRYMKGQKKHIYPLNLAKSNEFLRVFLVDL